MNIALTFSGGGYRAAGFGLGALSYLYLVPFEEQTLGHQVMLLSTVSGGTITGTRYALGLERKEGFPATFKAIYNFLNDTKLVENALGNLSNDENWKDGRLRSLISAFADVYDHALFDGAHFGELMSADEGRQLRHLSFNATEFAHGVQFRFQWSEKILDPVAGQKPRGVIGNNYYDLQEEVAKELRLGDILASSSCFPAGFEPINFPGDFLPGYKDNTWKSGMDLPVGLMDGGVVDNQGITPVLLAEARMQHNREARAKHAEPPVTPSTEPEIDLIFVSDVASPYLKSYQQSRENKKGWLRKTKVLTLVIINAVLVAAGIAAVVWSYGQGKAGWLLVSAIASTVFTLLFLVLWFIGSLPKMFKVPEEFLKPLGKLLRLPLYVYEGLLFNRVNSFKILAMNVFLKHERAMNYDTIYGDKRWKNRLIMCAAYELRTADVKERQQGPKRVPAELVPSPLLQDLADKASAFDTTLWFTDKDFQAHILDLLIACGQATACWNLLEYIWKLKNSGDNINAAHQKLIAQEETIKKHWEALQADPFALLSEYYGIKELLKPDQATETVSV